MPVDVRGHVPHEILLSHAVTFPASSTVDAAAATTITVRYMNVNDVEQGRWASPVLLIWAADSALQVEFDSVCDFFEWAQGIATRLIEWAYTHTEE